MYVAHLSLHDFRSYAEAEVPLDPGPRRSSAATARARPTWSRRSTTSPASARTGSPATPAGAVRRRPRRGTRGGGARRARGGARGQINPGSANKARVNRSPLPRARELLGLVRTVVFSPEDLALVKGDPSERRRFLDDLLVQRTPRYAGVRADYDRVLKQRNSLLKTAGTARRGSGSQASARCPRSGSGTPTSPGPAPSSSPSGCAWSTSCGPTSARPTPTVARGATRADATRPTSRPSSCRRDRPPDRTRRPDRARCSPRWSAAATTSSTAASPWSGRTATTCVAGAAATAAGQGLRLPRRVLVVRARAAAGVLRPAARRRRRPDPDPRRRLRRARHRAPRPARRAGRRRRAGAGHRGGAPTTCPRCSPGARFDVVDGKVTRCRLTSPDPGGAGASRRGRRSPRPARRLRPRPGPQHRPVAGPAGGPARARAAGRARVRPPAPRRPQASGAHPDDRDPQLLDSTIGRLIAEQGWGTDVAGARRLLPLGRLVGREVAAALPPRVVRRRRGSSCAPTPRPGPPR